MINKCKNLIDQIVDYNIKLKEEDNVSCKINILKTLFNQINDINIDDIKKSNIDKTLILLSKSNNRELSEHAKKLSISIKNKIKKPDYTIKKILNYDSTRLNIRKLLYDLLYKYKDEVFINNINDNINNNVIESILAVDSINKVDNLKQTNTIEKDIINDNNDTNKIISDITDDIESSLYKMYVINDNTIIKSDNIKNYKNYINKSKELYSYIKTNQELRKTILLKLINADDLLKLDIQTLLNKEILERRKKLQEDHFNSRRTDWEKKQKESLNIEGFYKCYRCNTKKTYYFQMQTRRADEGMTTFVSCLNCGNNWKC